MKLVRYNQLEPQYPSTFSGLLDRVFNDTVHSDHPRFTPSVDISEDEKNYEIALSVPGVKKEDFKIDLEDGKLTVSGERKKEEKKEGKNFHSLESQYGAFSRSFYLPEDIAAENISAQYENGILTISLPKIEKKVSKSMIEVK
ncbi:Hsp20/alpha crystallin family protein [Echinicola jeungdonensis]|uniref:Hsp20/alpha crystallin family protein n=1 Tax=Echinicola jeungdonensis TaxID=709343 RepID=A0ABV5J1J2_9BACT|nr:Hsp20/alpha crystallin family protein [Echinicola jeungdonensis]MDN3668525.1 Hsp20/alpha crystallin family protein [Echinicola jeungdonensis]